jgi:hypothetical protein
MEIGRRQQPPAKAVTHNHERKIRKPNKIV